MNRTFVGILLGGCIALVFCGPAMRCTAADPSPISNEATTAKIKILTWNIQMLPVAGGLIGEECRCGQSMRTPWIIEYLNRQDCDVVVLQEAFDYVITAQLKRGLKERYPFLVAPPSKLGLVATSGGVLFLSKIPLRYIAHFVYQNSADVDALAEKGCTLVEAETHGVRFQIAGTHLQAGHADVRQKQIAEVSQKVLKPHAKQGIPQFLVGDLNVEAGTADYHRLLKTTEMRDFPVDDARPFTIDPRNSWKGPNQNLVRLDYVLLNPHGTETTVARQAIQRPTHEHNGKNIDLSDHYGVIAEVTLKNK